MVSESELKNGLAFWAPGTQIPELPDPRMALPGPAFRQGTHRPGWTACHTELLVLLATSWPTCWPPPRLSTLSEPAAQVKNLEPFVRLCFLLFPFCFLLLPFVSLLFPFCFPLLPFGSLCLPFISVLSPFVSLLCFLCFPVVSLLSPSGSLLPPCCLPGVSLLSPVASLCLPVVSLLLPCCYGWSQVTLLLCNSEGDGKGLVFVLLGPSKRVTVGNDTFPPEVVAFSESKNGVGIGTNV